jgi:probable HAF family extracellular repeat protein
VVGIAETNVADSLDENWSCSAFFPSVTKKVCRGFAWENDVMTAMPTFGGTHSYATGVNGRGDVVGWAETAVHHESCVAPQRLQFVAAIWSPRRGTMRQLRPLGDDPTSAATAINERGQVVGISGLCDDAVGKFSAISAVMWDRDEVIDLGNLGGEAWHTPTAINERGEVVGFSNPTGVTGGEFLPRAFKWTRHSGMVELNLIDGDTFAQAYGINSRGQVVGRSCGGPAGCRAVIWDGTTPTLLKHLVDPAFPHVLAAARDINNAGVITGNLTHATTGHIHAFTARVRR